MHWAGHSPKKKEAMSVKAGIRRKIPSGEYRYRYRYRCCVTAGSSTASGDSDSDSNNTTTGPTTPESIIEIQPTLTWELDKPGEVRLFAAFAEHYLAVQDHGLSVRLHLLPFISAMPLSTIQKPSTARKRRRRAAPKPASRPRLDRLDRRKASPP